ncbi:MAG: cytochrome b/b6 domain-containing protein [Burkholderiales bacterium]|nr:cytochrome b/b6 domain-containing protein [Burkholderiales bacterium]MDE1925745.1 cytochrome b/b6 domain-containing protein [Burkholderiales bacterium]MDE2158269.1 cytochrome b/b6 domain-containing protein [Burkholderiales bacterium]MDE2502581.1 cytochrome b/b6 domain-containing protein [Burkholderiales bacterium]
MAPPGAPCGTLPTETALTAAAPTSYLYRRHSLPVRLMHWINVVSLTVLLMSGLMIFNAHPALDWGASSYVAGRHSLLMIGTMTSGAHTSGVTQVLGRNFDTTGWLGLSRGPDGMPNAVAFPSWMTLPGSYSLAEARLWHFFFAWVFVLNGLAYVGHALASGHLRRDLWPTRADLRGFGRSIVDHLRFRHPQGEEARNYNVLQKFAYLVVIFGLLPLIILCGWAMSPWLDSLRPGWVDWLGGRQSARTIHFLVAWLLVGFVGIHVFEVIVSGLWNHLRSMITGRYRITVHHE